MSKQNSTISTNKKWWEKMAKEKCGFTLPWLNLDSATVKKYTQGKLKRVPKELKGIYPASILKNVKNKKVLCLASGGGQQSAVFGLLGAQVTVVDVSERQLEGDRKAAEHYGYRVKTIQGDMNDLSMLKNKSFDFVYQAPSLSYVPDVKPVFREAARILKKGGLYRVDAQNPLAEFLKEESWDGKGYRISVPYAVKRRKRSRHENVFDFRHNLDETFNGLIESGFTIERLEEMPPDVYQNGKPKPGSWEHLLLYAPGLFAILARKK